MPELLTDDFPPRRRRLLERDAMPDPTPAQVELDAALWRLRDAMYKRLRAAGAVDAAAATVADRFAQNLARGIDTLIGIVPPPPPPAGGNDAVQ